jgi:deoxyribose-phosphate aldolase
MLDWSKVKDPAVAKRLRLEGQAFMARCHYGVQGVAKTEEDVRAALKRLLDSGFTPIAFDTEVTFIPLARDITQGKIKMHSAVSYPLGRMTLKKKLQDLENLVKMGVEDTCVCLDWQAIFSHRYKDVEREAYEIMKEFGDKFDKNALVIPATLLSDTEMIDVLKALDSAGVYSVKVNPGCKLGVSYEEVMLINRHFPHRFDIHPSGNIRKLEEVEKYLELGCTVIHTVKSLDITEVYLERQLKLYEGGLWHEIRRQNGVFKHTAI